MKVWMLLRSCLARATFFALRIPLGRFEKEVSRLWGDGSADRRSYLNGCLADTRPMGATEDRISNLAEIESQQPMTKKRLRELSLAHESTSHAFARHTAGTSGEPTSINLSREELARMLSVRSYCYRHHGLRLGQREARLWGRSADTSGAKLRDFILNRKVFYPAEKEVKKTVARLIEWRPDYIYGYTSLILEAARVVTEEGLRPEGIKAVVCTAEAILPTQKEYISNAFNAPVLEEYGSTEFDIIAFECVSGHLHLVNPWLWVETMDGEALITDVTRRSQSIVRYRLGDSFKMSNSECASLGSSWVIEELHGRSINQFAYLNPGEKFHAVVLGRAVDAYMNQFGDCFNFTVRQTDYCRFELYASEVPARGNAHLESWLVSKLRTQLNIPESTEFELSVTAGEALMRRGKHTYFIQDIV